MPVVLRSSALSPVAVLKLPVGIVTKSAPAPLAVLLWPVVLSKESSSATGRVGGAGGVAKESTNTTCRVLVTPVVFMVERMGRTSGRVFARLRCWKRAPP